MYSLLLDSSSFRCIIAINKAGQTIQHIDLKFEEDISRTIFPEIKKILTNTKITLDDLSFISIGKGPGSYTGIRIAKAIGQSISYIKKIPTIGFCSLKSIIPKKNTPFISILKASGGKIHLLEGIKNDNLVNYKEKPIVLTINEILNSYKNHFIISTSEKLIKEISNLTKNCESLFPNSSHLAKLSYKNFVNKNFKSELIYS